MQSSDILNYALTILIGFTLISGMVTVSVMIKLLQALTKLVRDAGVFFVTMKTIKSGLQYSIYDVLSRGLNKFQTKRG